MRIRIINRVVTFHEENQSILLVRNLDATFWYPPGGEWEAGSEEIRDGAIREVYEEVGIRVEIDRLLYVRTFDPDQQTQHLELVWLAHTIDSILPENHQDHHGLVAEARWFNQQSLQDIKVFPKKLFQDFWVDVSSVERDPFID